MRPAFSKDRKRLVEELGLEQNVDIRMGTLSKSIAGLGGYFAGPTALRDYFVNTSRSLIYSTGLPIACWRTIWPRYDTFAAIRKRENAFLRKRLVSGAAWWNWDFHSQLNNAHRAVHFR